MDGLEPANDEELLADVRDRASVDLRLRIDGALAYEALASHLEVAFNALRWRSTHLGLSPLTPAIAAERDALREATAALPDSYAEAADALAALDIQLPLDLNLGHFSDPASPGDLAALQLAPHPHVPGAKH